MDKIVNCLMSKVSDTRRTMKSSPQIIFNLPLNLQYERFTKLFLKIIISNVKNKFDEYKFVRSKSWKKTGY